MRLDLRFFCAALAALTLGAPLARACEHCHESKTQAVKAPAPASDSVYQLASTWTDQDGKKVALGSLAGTPVVVAMVYTSCQGACPLTTSDMQAIEKRLGSGATRFVLVSFDPKRDTPAQLKAFAQGHKLGANWTLLTGTADDVRDLAAVLGVRFKQLPNGDFDHSNVISILDAGGVIRHQQLGLRQDPAESVQVLEKLGK